MILDRIVDLMFLLVEIIVVDAWWYIEVVDGGKCGCRCCLKLFSFMVCRCC